MFQGHAILPGESANEGRTMKPSPASPRMNRAHSNIAGESGFTAKGSLWRATIGRHLCVLLIAALFGSALRAQQQFQGVCANVKIEIQQELAFERIGFEATLEITNNLG